MHYHPEPYEESYTFFPGSGDKEGVVGEISLDGKVSPIKTGDTVVINSNVTRLWPFIPSGIAD